MLTQRWMVGTLLCSRLECRPGSQTQNNLPCDFHRASSHLTPAACVLWEVPLEIPSLDSPSFQVLQNAEVPRRDKRAQLSSSSLDSFTVSPRSCVPVVYLPAAPGLAAPSPHFLTGPSTHLTMPFCPTKYLKRNRRLPRGKWTIRILDAWEPGESSFKGKWHLLPPSK